MVKYLGSNNGYLPYDDRQFRQFLDQIAKRGRVATRREILQWLSAYTDTVAAGLTLNMSNKPQMKLELEATFDGVIGGKAGFLFVTGSLIGRPGIIGVH